MTDLVQKLVALISEAPHYFAPQHDFDGKKAEWFNAQRAALSEAKAGGWQPIETCPRDFGVTKFDVWANGQRYADCWWGKATYEQGESGIVHQSDYDCNGPVDSYVKGATAWQPLPAPPAQRGEG